MNITCWLRGHVVRDYEYPPEVLPWICRRCGTAFDPFLNPHWRWET